MRWSTRLLVLGIVIMLVGLIPPAALGVTIGSVESAASLIAVGLLVFLLGMLLRRLQKAFT